jgi:transposase
MDAYSLDLRERVLSDCDEGFNTQEEVAETFGVSVSFITKLLRRRRDKKMIVAKPHAGGGKPSLGQADLKRVRQIIDQRPDATLNELCGALKDDGGTSVKPWTMCRALQRLGLVRKKSPFTRRSGIRLA